MGDTKILKTWAGKILGLGLILIFSTNINAENPIGEAEASLDVLEFYPKVDYQQLTLTVAGQEVRWQERFGPNEVASFSVSNTKFPDGQYRYELVASPSLDQEAQELARRDMELMQMLVRAERESTFRQTGRFEIANGEIALLDDGPNLQSMNMMSDLDGGEIQ